MATIDTSKTALDSHELLALSEMLQGKNLRLTGQHGEAMALPEPLRSVLKETVRNLSLGLPVTVITPEDQVSTQVAADILGCSRPHVIKLLETGEMPFEMVGCHRRIRYADLLAFQNRQAQRAEGWNNYVREAVRNGHYIGLPLEDRRELNDGR
jgi:excisionase family DNA binding protein